MEVYDPADPVKPQGTVQPPSLSPEGQRMIEISKEMQRDVKDGCRECCNICIFFCFLTFFTVTMLLEQTQSCSRVADHIRAKLDGGAVPLASVSSISSLYRYLEQGLVPAVYPDGIDTRIAKDASTSLIPLDLSNRVLGTVRMRQLRVAQSSECQVSPMFQAYNTSCYPSLTPATESVESFGIEGRFTYSYDYEGVEYGGKFTTYSPHGFMQLLPTNSTLALAALAKLQENHFIDIATRAVFIEFNVWSSNVAAYAAVSVIVEFSASSGVKHKVDVLTFSEKSLVPGGLGFTSDVFAFIGVIVVMLFVIWYLFEELQEIWKHRFKYFLDPWNVMDWLNMILLIIAFVLRIINFVQAGDAKIGKLALADNRTFMNLRSIATRAMLVSVLHAVNAVLLWGKAVKYLRHVPVVKDLIRAVWGSFDLFLPFLCMFAVAFIGFVMAYNIGFGDKVWEMSTFYKTAVYLSRAFLRDIKMIHIYELTTPLFAALLILLFYVSLVLVGASFLFAIIADALYRAKYTPDAKPKTLTEQTEEFSQLLLQFFTGSKAKGHGQPKKQLDGGVAQGHPQLVAAVQNEHANESSSASGSTRSQTRSSSESKVLTRTELMRAIELMSGRVLSEISIVGIEIRSELHEVCERVAQMQMAVEELTHRAERIRMEQLLDVQ